MQPQFMDLERRHTPNNKLFSVVCHCKEILLPTPSCSLLDGRGSCEPVGCCCQLLVTVLSFPTPLTLLLWYDHIHIQRGTMQNNDVVAEVAISLQSEDADGFCSRL